MSLKHNNNLFYFVYICIMTKFSIFKESFSRLSEKIDPYFGTFKIVLWDPTRLHS